MLFRNISSVMAFSSLAQVVGFGRTLVIAAMFGASLDLDAYYLSLIVPGLVAGVVGGALQAGFVPVYVAALSRNELDKAARLRAAVMWWLTGLVTVICLVGIAAAPVWTGWIAGKGGTDLQQLTLVAVRITLISVLCNCLGDYLALVLNCHRCFAVAAAAPILNTVVSIGVLLAMGATVEALCISLVLGAVAQLSLIVWAIRVRGLSLPWAWSAPSGALNAVVRLGLPMTAGFVLTQLQLAYLQTLPAGLGEGAVSIFGYAYRLQLAVEQIFAIGFGTVILPHLAECVAKHDRAGVRRLIGWMAGLLIPVGIGAAVGIWVLGPIFVEFLLARGSFSPAMANQVSQVWFYLGLGLFPFAVSTVLSKLIMALGRSLILSVTAGLVLIGAYVLGESLTSARELAGVASVFVVVQILRLAIYTGWLGPYLIRSSAAFPRPTSSF